MSLNALVAVSVVAVMACIAFGTWVGSKNHANDCRVMCGVVSGQVKRFVEATETQPFQCECEPSHD